MENESMQRVMFTLANAHRLALLALFDAMTEMVGSADDEFRMRFIRHLEGRADDASAHQEARLLRDLVAQVRAERIADTTGDTGHTRPT
jgi:hypothetical protein